MRPSASTASLEDAATALAPLRRVRVDLVDLRYAPIVRDAKGNRAPKRVIHGCTTSFLPGTVSALMGPSGSGKTSLLTVIAGFVDQSHVSGNLLVNGERTQVRKRLVGIVFQDDLMLPALTAFETVKFAADLRMPRRCSDAERTEACDAILNELGLAHVRDQLVGGAARRGVSGGERKRLAVGVELVTRPALLLMDEPTSGLDAAAALSLMRTLRTLASRGQTVVAAIHQPRTTVFDSFDHLVLMSKGHALYDGGPDGCVGHLESLGLGLTLPPRTNPADWLMDVIAADESLGEDTRKLPEGWKNAKTQKEKRVFVVGDSDGAAGKRDDDDDEGASVWRQLRVLTVREDKSRRGQNLTAINAAQMLVMAILTAMFWWQMPDDTDAFVMERFSILFFCIIAQSNAVVFACVNTFAKERQLMIRENARGCTIRCRFHSQDCFGHRQHAGHAVPVRDGDVLVRGSEANGGGVLRLHNSLRAVHTGGAVAGFGVVVRHSGCPGVPHRGADGDSHADDFGRILRHVQQHAGVHTLAELVLAGQVRVHRDGGQRVQRPDLSVRSER